VAGQKAFGDRLVLRQVISSGGTFPVSVAIHGNLVYVVNALNGGSIQGYRLFFGRYEAHLAGCPHCTEYLAQMRKSIELTGTLTTDDLTPQMQDEFIALYRQWREEQ